MGSTDVFVANELERDTRDEHSGVSRAGEDEDLDSGSAISVTFDSTLADLDNRSITGRKRGISAFGLSRYNNQPNGSYTSPGVM